VGKKYCSIVAALALTGTSIAGALTYGHYYPGRSLQLVLCGGTFGGNCDALSQWEYASIFGIPISAYGLFLFLLVLFTILVADYAAGEYHVTGLLIILPIVVLSVLADVVLAGVMVWLQTFCLLCVATYLVNLLLMLTLYFWYRSLTHEGFSLKKAYGSLMMKESDSSPKKAVASLYVLFVFLLCFSVFSTSYVLQIKTYPARQAQEQMQKAIAAFFMQVPEKLDLPISKLRIGPESVKVQIVVFTDFLCSACYQFFQLEKELHAKYGEKISIIYYNYPLDRSCNKSLSQTLYNGSCIASQAMLSAASLSILKEYVSKHYSRYDEFHGQYSKDKAVAVADGLVAKQLFQQELDGETTKQIVQRDIELARKLNINATPTLFINGRRMEGVSPRDMMEKIIDRELKSGSAK
jgi:protein-disulfide isomerase/uncharacterized membrane protein